MISIGIVARRVDIDDTFIERATDQVDGVRRSHADDGQSQPRAAERAMNESPSFLGFFLGLGRTCAGGKQGGSGEARRCQSEKFSPGGERTILHGATPSMRDPLHALETGARRVRQHAPNASLPHAN